WISVERRKRNSGACYRVKKSKFRGLFENDEPAMRRTTDTGQSRKIETVEFIGGEVEE
ncbi:hypothetical protein A2U01_0043353, partial [Trifolium medium]|nr:hypothetical protein [Trifolium medium]